jgi:hypothetical protein
MTETRTVAVVALTPAPGQAFGEDDVGPSLSDEGFEAETSK